MVSLPFKAFALLFLLIIAGAASAVSPSEALDKVKPLLGDAVKDVATLEQPLEYLENRYYVFYFPITSSSRFFASVEELEGSLVTDFSQLEKLGNHVYRLEAVRRVLKPQQLGYVDLDSFAREAKRKVDTTRANYDSVVKGQLENKYPSIVFKNLDQKLASVSLALEVLGQRTSDGLALERAFESTYNSGDLESYLAGYNGTLAGMAEYMKAAEEYQTAVQTKGNEAVNSKTLTLTQKQEISDSLKLVFDVGAWEEYSRIYTTAKEEYDRRLARQAEWVNSSIQVFYYEKAKRDADEAYSAEEANARQLLAIEFDLRSCALEKEFTQLKTAWSEIEANRQRKDLTGYQAIVAKMPDVSNLIETLREKYNRCVSGATATPQPQTTGVDTATILFVVAVIAIGGFAYWQYRKRQMEQEEQY